MVLMDFPHKKDISTPLYIETDYEYKLDMTKFPGLEDPIAKLQPTLLIHDEGMCNCGHFSDLQTLLDSCADLECSESGGIIEDILGDSDYSTSYIDSDDFSDSIPATPNTSNDPLLDQLLRSVAAVSDSFTPDITTSLLNAEEEVAERTTLTVTNKRRKGVKRRLFSDNNYCDPAAKRQHVFAYDENSMFTILDDLFNH